MRRSRIAAAAAVVVLGTTGVMLYRNASATERPAYRFATVERGSLQSTVSATGSLSAVTTVQVGTQVSGQISAIHVDFNDKVRKGQLLARIDPTLQQQAVADAQAGVERAQSQLNLTKQEFDRQKTLFDAKVITATEFASTQSNYEVAKANMKSAQISLDKARQNLAYTSIYAPIDGVIVERTVDVGQTVAASLSAPELFLIANDLSQMQILAKVDESDIGAIQVGQPVRFTVQAYPNRTFTGAVKQVRLQSSTQDNVVNYTAVISVENKDGKLLPGMTATVEFLTGSASNVLLVPNAALRYRPVTAAGAAVGTTTGARLRDSTRLGARAGTPGAPNATGAAARSATGGMRASIGTLWYLDTQGKLQSARVRTGLTDGQKTEVQPRDSTSVKVGMQVIVGATTGTAAATSTSTSSPFQPAGGAARRGPGGPGGF